MRKLKFMIVAAGLLATTCTLHSCKKESAKVSNTTSTTKSKQNLRQPDPFVYYTLGTDILESDLIDNPEDIHDENYNKVEFALSLCLLEVYNNHPSLLNSLIQNINGTRNKCYNMFVFANQNPSVNTIFNSIFASRFNDFSSYGSNWKTYVEAKYKYDNDYYLPFARFANLGQINVALQSYVASPLEVNEEKFTNFDDNIPLWIKSGSTTLLSTVNEENAGLIENPIVLITNGKVGDESDVYETVASDQSAIEVVPPCPYVGGHESISHKKFKLTARYDKTGKSEYKFCYGTTVGFDVSVMTWVNKYNTPGYHYARGMKVRKRDLGKLLSFDFPVFHSGLYPADQCFAMGQVGGPIDYTFAVGAIESDWFSSKKDVYTVKDVYGNPLTYRDGRKFKHEWYFLDPATNNSYEFYVRNPFINTTYTNYTKGELQLLRW